jgi:hypothetical protein
MNTTVLIPGTIGSRNGLISLLKKVLMISTNSGKRYLLVVGKILLIAITAIGAFQLGAPASYIDPFGLFFVLIGGISLLMIGFSGSEIRCAFRHATGGSGSDAEIRTSAHFWEAAGRSFWILGGLNGVLNILLCFMGMRTLKKGFAPAISSFDYLLPSLLSIFYGCLLAVICFVPCWKLLGILQNRPAASDQEQNQISVSAGRSGSRLRPFGGYIFFLIVLILTNAELMFPHPDFLIHYGPSLFVVLGGTFALILFTGANNTKLTVSTAFASMGFIGTLMGFTQMVIGITGPDSQFVGHTVMALTFVLYSCFNALLGIALVGAPLEDRAIRTGRIKTPSAFSRVSWYVFPLLSLLCLILVLIFITSPLL